MNKNNKRISFFYVSIVEIQIQTGIGISMKLATPTETRIKSPK